MPTHDEDDRFLRDLKHLTHAEQEEFKNAVVKFVHDLRTGTFRPGLRIKGYQREEGVFEMTWAPNGHALFRYGDEVRPGDPHIIWLRIGSHDILE